MLSPVCLVGNRVRAANKGPHQRGTCMFSRLELEGWEKSDSGESLLRVLILSIWSFDYDRPMSSFSFLFLSSLEDMNEVRRSRRLPARWPTADSKSAGSLKRSAVRMCGLSSWLVWPDDAFPSDGRRCAWTPATLSRSLRRLVKFRLLPLVRLHTHLSASVRDAQT